MTKGPDHLVAKDNSTNTHNQIYYQKALFGTAVCLVKSYDCIYLRFFPFIKSKTTFPCPNSSLKPTDSCTVADTEYAVCKEFV